MYLQGILYTSLNLNLTPENKEDKEETKVPRERTGKIQGTGDILSELEMNAAKEIEENNSTPVPVPVPFQVPSEEDKEEEKKKEESEEENEDYDDNDPNETDKDDNRRKDKKIRGQGFKEDSKLEDNGKENENKVKRKE